MKKIAVVFLSLVLSLASPFAARASILFVGGEDSDFVNLNGAAAVTTAGTFSSGYARESMEVYGSGGCASNSPPASYFMTPNFTANSIIWIHANYYSGNGLGCSYGGDILRVYSPDGYPRIVVTQPGTNLGQFSIYTRNQAGTQTLLVSMTSPCFSGIRLTALDLYINYASSGEVTLYCNNAQVADYSGNILTDSATQLNKVQFAGEISQTISYWSEVIVSTSNTTAMRLATLAPSANGNTDTWDTGGVSNINETTLNTTTVNASGTAGEVQEYTVGSLPSGNFSILGVWVNAQALVDTTGPQHIQGMVRTGSTDFTSSNLARLIHPAA